MFFGVLFFVAYDFFRFSLNLKGSSGRPKLSGKRPGRPGISANRVFEKYVYMYNVIWEYELSITDL